MNIKTNLLEKCVNFVDNTKKQNKYFKIIMSLIVIIMFFVFIYTIIRMQGQEYMLLYSIK